MHSTCKNSILETYVEYPFSNRPKKIRLCNTGKQFFQQLIYECETWHFAIISVSMHTKLVYLAS